MIEKIHSLFSGKFVNRELHFIVLDLFSFQNQLCFGNGIHEPFQLRSGSAETRKMKNFLVVEVYVNKSWLMGHQRRK